MDYLMKDGNVFEKANMESEKESVNYLEIYAKMLIEKNQNSHREND